MTRDEAAAKVRDLVASVIGGANAKRLIDTVLALDTVKDVRTTRPLLQRA